MNKQQLASLIWDYCNGLRGSISTVEYKDFILGFIFYRYLSDKEEEFLRSQDWTEEAMREELNESDLNTVEQCKENNGYFIPYEYLFSTWKNSVDIAKVSAAINSFTRNISQDYLKTYEGIFKTFGDKLPSLGTNANEQSAHVRKIVKIVSQIPMSDKEGYDVLGFIYEYLLANFASNAGKKDGEFYTPHEVSLLMSEIVAHHLKDREHINIYDPTSGSGSLLINIGQSIQKYLNDKDNVIYYAQEKIEDTYNLTRMNLIMRGIKPSNIVVRCGDTLKQDWPYLDEKNVYSYVPVDCVVSNPPYSQKWNPDDYKKDTRYKNYGLAPSSKADYAFLLHDLYHLQPDGIMAIVLPHGVLFRGGSEAEIRAQLIEKNNIETIIGLPANIFYGTGIPTIIMILKKNRPTSDILFIDASKEFYKDGNKNKLAGHHIKKIVDTVINRKSVSNFAKLVEKTDIIKNEYNLNITRYVSSNVSELPYDIYSTIYGNIPAYELDAFNNFWDTFKSLKPMLFSQLNSHVYELITDNIKKTILNNPEVIEYKKVFVSTFEKIKDQLKEILILSEPKNIEVCKNNISKLIFDSCENFSLIDKYLVYKAFDDAWNTIAMDLDIIIKQGKKVCREIENIEEYDKKSQEIIVKGDDGKVISYVLIAKVLYSSDFETYKSLENEIVSLSDEIASYWEELDEEFKLTLQKEGEDKLDTTLLKNKYNEILDLLTNETIKLYENYNNLKPKEKVAFELEHSNLKWPEESSRTAKGIFNASKIKELIISEKNVIELDEADDDFKVRYLYLQNEKLKHLKKTLKEYKSILDEKAKEKIAQLADEEIHKILEIKWITPIIDNINTIPDNLFLSLTNSINQLVKKYENPLTLLNTKIEEVESNILSMLDELTGDEYDMLGLNEFKKLLGGDNNGK